ncbi:heat shock 70 kDa protein, mitochondrial [Tanacetum coccineum]
METGVSSSFHHVLFVLIRRFFEVFSVCVNLQSEEAVVVGKKPKVQRRRRREVEDRRNRRRLRLICIGKLRIYLEKQFAAHVSTACTVKKVVLGQLWQWLRSVMLYFPTVYVGNLDPVIMEDELRQLFMRFGDMVSTKIPGTINKLIVSALSYGLNSKERLIVVLHLGDGTFDVSILEIPNGVFERLNMLVQVQVMRFLRAFRINDMWIRGRQLKEMRNCCHLAEHELQYGSLGAYGCGS